MTGGNGAAAPELGLFVMRSGARREQERILGHIKTLFDVHRVYEIHWTRELVSENYVRFYRGPLGQPAALSPEELAEEGCMLLVIAVDGSPRYETRTTDAGPASVNVNFFDAREKFRAWAGGGAHVHGSLSADEAARDLMLLLGTDPKTLLQENSSPWDGRTEEVRRDLSGARGWTSPIELFYALNYCVRYIVLRNFEELPHCLHVGSHEDVDLLTDDYPEMLRVMNARPNARCIPKWGGPYWVKIAGQDMWFDVRFVGDRYYDPKWAGELLDRRVWNPAGFYAPCVEDYFESLAYHAVVHKTEFSPDYKKRLAAIAGALGRSGWSAAALDDPQKVKGLLDTIVKARGCRYRRPRDVNVFYNFEAVGYRWPGLRRKLAGVFRKTVRVGYRAQRPVRKRYQAAKSTLRYKTPRLTDVLRRPGPA
jgi:hypothetical protein